MLSSYVNVHALYSQPFFVVTNVGTVDASVMLPTFQICIQFECFCVQVKLGAHFAYVLNINMEMIKFRQKKINDRWRATADFRLKVTFPKVFFVTFILYLQMKMSNMLTFTVESALVIAQ